VKIGHLATLRQTIKNKTYFVENKTERFSSHKSVERGAGKLTNDFSLLGFGCGTHLENLFYQCKLSSSQMIFFINKTIYRIPIILGT
jgi:hypothetical protein